MAITTYLNHLPTCNLEQDWSEAEEALASCPPGPDTDAAYRELRERKTQCSCGMDKELRQYAKSWYEKGYRDRTWQDTTDDRTPGEMFDAHFF